MVASARNSNNRTRTSENLSTAGGGPHRRESSQAPCTCHDWNALGTSAGASKVTSSHASWSDSRARDKALLSPCPDLYAVYLPINGCPSRYRSPIASSTLCLATSLS